MIIPVMKDDLTVAELKAIVNTWPEKRADGSSTVVIIGDLDNCTNSVTEISTLGRDENGVADLMISITRG